MREYHANVLGGEDRLLCMFPQYPSVAEDPQVQEEEDNDDDTTTLVPTSSVLSLTGTYIPPGANVGKRAVKSSMPQRSVSPEATGFLRGTFRQTPLIQAAISGPYLATDVSGSYASNPNVRVTEYNAEPTRQPSIDELLEAFIDTFIDPAVS